MELFISNNQPADTLSLAIELFCIYVRAPERSVTSLNVLTPETLAVLKLEHVPLLIKTVSTP